MPLPFMRDMPLAEMVKQFDEAGGECDFGSRLLDDALFKWALKNRKDFDEFIVVLSKITASAGPESWADVNICLNRLLPISRKCHCLFSEIRLQRFSPIPT